MRRDSVHGIAYPARPFVALFSGERLAHPQKVDRFCSAYLFWAALEGREA